jgi:two-component system, cell cycle sensor histidine kinase and response regulator CckA
LAERGRGWIAPASGIATILLGSLGFLGWVTPWRWLSTLDPKSIPMAPSTALILIALGVAVVMEMRRPSPWLAIPASALALTFSCAQLPRFVGGLSPAVDELLVPNRDLLQQVLAGPKSPWTVLGLILASLSLLFGSLSLLSVNHPVRRRDLGTAAGGLACAVALVGSLVTIGYLFDAPLLYGGGVVASAYPTGLAFGCLGLTLLLITPRDSAPIRVLVGPSANARLLRAFLPVAPIIVLVELLVGRVHGLSPTLEAAVTALASAVVVACVVSYNARGVGRELERSRRDTDRLAAIVQSSTDAIYAKNVDGKIIAWNPSAERLFGYSADEALGRSATILLAPDGESELSPNLSHIAGLDRIDQQQTTRIRKNGTSVPVFLSESSLWDVEGKVVGVSAIARDVSAQREAEQALIDSEERFRQIAENIHQVFWLTDPAREIVLYVSQAYEEIWGRDRRDLLASPGAWVEAMHPDDRARIRGAARATQAVGEYSEEYRIVRPDGSIRWIWDRAFPVRGENGEVLRVAGLAEDITERKRVDDELRESERRFSGMLANLHLVSLMLDKEARITYCNDYLLQLTGWGCDEVIGGNWFELFVPPEANRQAEFALLLSNAPDAWHDENEILTRAGGRRLIRWNNSVLRAPSGEVVGTSSIGEDVTDHRRTEAQLLQAQKMEAVGRLAGGVAHDFNNALGVILGYTELLMRQAGDAQRAKLQQILKASERAAGLTRQLLAFSRRQVIDPKVLDLNALLADVQRMLGRLIGEDIEIVVIPCEGLGRVRADLGQLEQVVMNLCVNARDAMPGGGELRIQTANVDVDAGYTAQDEPMAAGRYVMLAVTDNGSGIEKEMIPKIFEPFFTTKDTEKGTGLGLATVYGIVKQSGGFVWVYSELKQGTCFKIYLPRVDDAVDMAEVRAAPMPSRGTETILLVEDEAALRTIARETLEAHGYRVIEAGSAKDAIEVARGRTEPIQLLLTDVVMPGMNGRALAEALVAERPGLKVIYMSGYTDDVIAHSGVLETGVLLLEKPFSALALLGRVRQALGEQATAGPAAA